ncbi:MAG: sulfatase-like hydrolase/transferase [Nitrospirota bacterium]
MTTSSDGQNVTGNRMVFIGFLHLFALAGFAIAQPLYDLLGQNPEFFVSHKASPGLIIGMVFVLSIGAALSLVLFELAAWLVGEPVRRSMHWVFVFGLVMLTVLPPVKHMVDGPDLLIVASALLFSFFFFVLYVRWQAVGLFLTVLSPVVMAFPLWFLFGTPVGRLVMPDVIEAQTDIEINNPVPVVLVVFDEFNITALLDAQGRIDPVRFPNFAALASQSWWFPNAVAVSGSTERAVPAILTGRQPQPDLPLTPTANDYPQNLFTMLGGQYRLNVKESVATLCPDSLCGQEGDPVESRRYLPFFSDLTVIYLHIIAPPKSGQRLPPLGAQWVGFGGDLIEQFTFQEHKVGSPSKYKNVSHLDRDLILDDFLSQIEENPNPVLHFLHVILPHVTYEYLASGHKYLPGEGKPFPDGIINEAGGWIGAKPLILTTYHQYLQQVGYVDRFLGKLRHSLETAHLYDKALIILTADHGVSFQSGSSRRGIGHETARDILRIPMIMKLPNQREGKISEQFVSSVDVLPTIANVLKVKVPWGMDGHYMFATNQRPRTQIEIPGVGHFTLKDLEGFPRLKWQVDHFEEHTSLDQVVPKGPYPDLIGQKIVNLEIAKPGAMRFINPDLNHFDYVKPKSGFLPALFRAHIVETNRQNLPIAVALNGQVWGTTTTSEWKENPNFFSVLLPPAAFIEGPNIVGVYLIEEPAGKILLTPLNDGRPKVALEANQSGNLILLFADEHEILVETGSGVMRGGMSHVSSMGNMLVIQGWAADIENPEPAEAVLIFSGKDLVLRIAPGVARPDVVVAQKQEGLLFSGFRAVVPLEYLKSDVNEIKIIVESKKGRALHFPFNDEQKDVIRAALQENFASQGASQ